MRGTRFNLKRKTLNLKLACDDWSMHLTEEGWGHSRRSSHGQSVMPPIYSRGRGGDDC